MLAGDLFQNSSLLHSIPSKASEQVISTSAILDVNYYLKLQGVPKKALIECCWSHGAPVQSSEVQVVRVIRVVNLDDMIPEDIWFSCHK